MNARAFATIDQRDAITTLRIRQAIGWPRGPARAILPRSRGCRSPLHRPAAAEPDDTKREEGDANEGQRGWFGHGGDAAEKGVVNKSEAAEGNAAAISNPTAGDSAAAEAYQRT